jgi:hypothetical protein
MADMKKIFLLSILISLAMICSCQKQDSVADLNQRKAQLDVREKSLNERESALQERERAVAHGRIIPPGAQSSRTRRDMAEMQAEREKKLQQLPPELRALIPPPSQMRSTRIEKPGEPSQQNAQSGTPDPRRMEAEREKKLQQLPPELRALIPPPSNLRSASDQKDRRTQTQFSQSQASGPSPTAGESPSPSPSPTPQ